MKNSLEAPKRSAPVRYGSATAKPSCLQALPATHKIGRLPPGRGWASAPPLLHGANTYKRLESAEPAWLDRRVYETRFSRAGNQSLGGSICAVRYRRAKAQHRRRTDESSAVPESRIDRAHPGRAR